MRPQRRYGLTAGLLSGGAAGLLLLAPQLADAAGSLTQAPPTTEPTDTTPDTTTASGDATATDDSADATAEQGDDPGTTRREERLQDVLQPLVDDGTLTQEQADSVIAALQAAGPNIQHDGPMHGGAPGGPGFPGNMEFPGGPGFPGDMGFPGEFQIFAEGPGISVSVGLPFGPETADVVANAIGIELSDLLTQLTDGQTVAEIATANGVDPQAVIDAVVQQVSERLTAAVDSGRLTQEEADERLASGTERITNWINGTGRPEATPEAGTEPSATETTTPA